MKKYVLGFLCGIFILGAGCAEREPTLIKEQAGEKEKPDLTIMHIDAEAPGFQEYIAHAEEVLDLNIEVLPCPENADNRQAKISTILSAGESSVDIFSVNDEMVSEFKHKGYLEPLNDTVMTKEVLDCYPKGYMENIAMLDGKIYSVPYFLDIMVYWVNKSMLGDWEIRTKEDFTELLNHDFGERKYGYGSAWDSAYAYNELSEFINLFGGSYYEWENPRTREALDYLYHMAQAGLVPAGQVKDQYEQMEQKFLDGTYASILMYSGAMDTFVRAGAYREEYIQVAPLPEFLCNTTNIAAWQYVLNQASEQKEAAVRFLNYAAGREGSISYSEYMNRLPARLDIIKEEDLDIPGFEELRAYVEHTELRERPFSKNTMKDITGMGELFQKYVLGEISQEKFCEKAQEITNGF